MGLFSECFSNEPPSAGDMIALQSEVNRLRMERDALRRALAAHHDGVCRCKEEDVLPPGTSPKEMGLV